MPRTRFASRQRLVAQLASQYLEHDVVVEGLDMFEELRIESIFSGLVGIGSWGHLPPGNEIWYTLIAAPGTGEVVEIANRFSSVGHHLA